MGDSPTGRGSPRICKVLLASRPAGDRRSAATASAAAVFAHVCVTGALLLGTTARPETLRSPAREDAMLLTFASFAVLPATKTDAPTGTAARRPRRGTVAPTPAPFEPDISSIRVPPKDSFVSLDPGFVMPEYRESSPEVRNGELTYHELEAAPTFTPYDIAPRLRNRAEIRDVLQRAYLVSLQREAVGGRLYLWLLIDDAGRVRKSLVFSTSGSAALDSIALATVDKMKFSPGSHLGRRVTVWVQQPVVFQPE